MNEPFGMLAVAGAVAIATPNKACMIATPSIVRAQLRIAAGATLADLGLADGPPAPRGHAIQLRINMERVNPDGSIMPSGGRLTAFDPPSGAGVRVETLGYQGYETSSRYDGLLAKLVVHSDGSFAEMTRRAYRALCEFRIEGVDTNIRMLKNLLCRPEFSDNRFDTQFLELHAAALATGSIVHPTLHASGPSAVEDVAGETEISIPGAGPVRTPLQGNLVSLHAAEGDLVRAGQKIAVVEAMKMETVVLAETSGRVVNIARRPGDAMRMGEAILFIEAMNEGEVEDPGDSHIEPDPAEAMTALVELVQEQHAKLLDESRPATVAKARKRGSGTARERIAQLCDAGSFMEFGGLARMHHLGDAAPADGVVTGTARIGGRPVAIVSQDFSVFGGSVGHLGSTKMDRAIELALAHGMPLVMLLDGGGHRIHDGQNSREYAAAGPVFQNLARLSGYVPIVAAVLGAGFAANTNYSGFADFVVMVRDRATMGLAGPALVKAGTGEIISAQELGGADAQVERHGLADLAVDTEQEALAALMRFLGYLPGNAGIAPPATAADPADDDAARAERLLSAVPVNTRQTYDVRDVIEPIADDGSTFEFKPGFARNIVTAFARLGGKPVGFIANQALHRGGMLDGPACEKAARFIAICDAFGLPLVFLIDVPGFFIGSEAEKSVLGRRSAKLLSELGHSTVPRVSIVLRKGYGLGYLAMAGGRSFEADAALAWPTAEICAMSVEGSVDVAFKQDYNAAPDPQIRRQELIDEMRARIGPVQAAEGFGIDDLIDPRMSRTRLLEVFGRTPARQMKRMPPKFRSIPPI